MSLLLCQITLPAAGVEKSKGSEEETWESKTLEVMMGRFQRESKLKT